MADPDEQDVLHPEIIDDASIPADWIELDLPDYEQDWSDDYDSHGK